jgi:hypothetical protein
MYSSKVSIGLPVYDGEKYLRSDPWLKAFQILKETSMLIVPVTGLLTDVYGLKNWGAYSVFKWSLVAKLRRCKPAS